MFSKVKTDQNALKSSSPIDSARAFGALGDAYSKAMEMLPPERRKAWAEKLAGSVKNRPKTRPLARGEMRANTSRSPLARPTA